MPFPTARGNRAAEFKATEVNGLQNTCDVGMHFGKFREYSIKMGNDKKLRMPSGKCHNNDLSPVHHFDPIIFWSFWEFQIQFFLPFWVSQC